VLEAAEHR